MKSEAIRVLACFTSGGSPIPMRSMSFANMIVEVRELPLRAPQNICWIAPTATSRLTREDAETVASATKGSSKDHLVIEVGTPHGAGPPEMLLRRSPMRRAGCRPKPHAERLGPGAPVDGDDAVLLR